MCPPLSTLINKRQYRRCYLFVSTSIISSTHVFHQLEGLSLTVNQSTCQKVLIITRRHNLNSIRTEI